jgi:glutathione peroxidase
MNSIHQFIVPSIEGGIIDFSNYRGIKILIVNTASECGYTPQYAQLQELYNQFKDKLVVVGVPSNDFGGQEPGDNQQIKEFCTIRYGVTFPLTAKQVVKGQGQSSLYQWLTNKDKNGVKDIDIQWNFHKIVLDENGLLINDFAPHISPFDDDLISSLGIQLS